MVFSPAAFAYLDPGSGSLLLQAILGGVAGLLVAGKLFWWRILAFFGIKQDSESETASED
ncbi:MAG: hypothetical protein AAF358_00240 [Pseudomonadota bacterium]